MRRPGRGARVELAVGLAAVLVALVIRLPNLDQPLLERQPFRQTQTAYTALLFHQRGVDLLHPELPVLGPPGEVPFELPLFQAIASVPMAHGVAPDVALRVTNIFFFLLTSLLLWGMVRELAGRWAGLLALLAFLFGPFSLLWGRTSMIEYLVTAGAVGYVWAGVRWQIRRRPLPLVAALVCGTVAMAVKPTTVVFWLLPLLAFRPPSVAPELRAWVRSRFEPGLMLMVVLPAVAGLAWTRHADAIKAAQVATEFLTTKGLQDWNFGTLAQRLRPGEWVRALGSAVLLIAGPPVWLALLHRRWRPTRHTGFWLAMIAATFLPIIVFFNLYVVHDYYSIAISPQVAALFGVTAAGLAEAVRPERRRFVVMGAVAWVVVLTVAAAPYWIPAYQRHPKRSIRPLELAQELRRTTTRQDKVLILGLDWSPAVPYYARREVQMLPTALTRSSVVGYARERDYRTLLTTQRRDLATFLSLFWPWVGSIGPHTLRFGETPGEIPRARVLGSEDPPPSGTTPTGPPVVVRCDAHQVQVPVTGPAAWLQLEGQVRSWLNITGAPGSLPFRPTVLVRDPGSSIGFGCEGPGSVTVRPMTGPAA